MNKWVTNDDWLPAADLVELLEKFDVHLARPGYLVNRWLSGIVRLYRDEIVDLIAQREEKLFSAHTDLGEALFDRSIVETSQKEVSLADVWQELSGSFLD